LVPESMSVLRVHVSPERLSDDRALL
jgi:hypothetical protein